MPAVTVPHGTASQILAAAGVEENHSFYGPFTNEADKAVLTVPMRITAAWMANDPDTFASIFTDNGSLLMQDTQLTSREEIRAYMAAGFQGPLKGARVTGAALSVTHLSNGVAMAVTQGGILLPGETEIAPERTIRAIWIIVAHAGQWQLLSHQSSPIGGRAATPK